MNIPLIIVAVVVVILVIMVVSMYNSLTRLRNKTKTNWAQIDVQLKRRADMIPNLVSTVKGYASHEKETLEAAIEARSAYVGASGAEAQMAAGGDLNQALSRLMMLSEAYPDLKANTNFIQLQEEISATEDKLSFARQFYNDSVYTYHNKLEMFPSNIVASMFGFKHTKFFEIEEADKAVPKVDF